MSLKFIVIFDLHPNLDWPHNYSVLPKLNDLMKLTPF